MSINKNLAICLLSYL